MLAGSQTLKSALLNDMALGNHKSLELDLYPSKLNDVFSKTIHTSTTMTKANSPQSSKNLMLQLLRSTQT